MKKLVEQVNDFSKKRLLTRLIPLLAGFFIASYCLQSTQLFVNFISLVIIFWSAHPYLINFEQETTDYLKYLKSQESYLRWLIIKKKRALRKYRKIKPLDLAHSRGKFRRLKGALQNNLKEANVASYYGFDTSYYLSFQRNLKIKIIRINSVAITKKKMLLQSIQNNIKNLENRKKNIILMESMVASQKAIPLG